MGAPGLLARMFCFSAGTRVQAEPRRRSAARDRAAEQAPPPPPSGSPTAAEALAAYLGRQRLTAPASPPPRDTSAEESITQSSTYNSGVSSRDSGGSGGAAHDPGYEADSDDDFQLSSEDSVTSRGRRFRPAVRHYKAEARQERQQAAGTSDEPAGGAAAVEASSKGGGAEQAGAAVVGELIEQFERLSISSGSRCGSPASLGAAEESEQEPPTVPAVRAQHSSPWLGTSTCTAEVLLHPPTAAPSQRPSTDGRPGTATFLPPAAAAVASALAGAAAATAGSKTVSRCSSATSLAASGSISLAHFLGGDSAAGSSRSNSFKVRRLGSTQVVVADPDSPAANSARSAAPEGAAEPAVDATPAASAAATPSRPPLLPKTHSGSSTSSGGSGAASRSSSGSGRTPQVHLQPGAAAVVQRRLNEIQSGHYITFEKLRSQCGDFQEPPGDLLSLMARRVFASRSSSLMQRLCSEGLLSDLQAGDSGQPTPSQGTGALHSPRGPARALAGAAGQPPTAQQQGTPEQPEAPAAAAVEDGLPRLPRIRTRVGQPRPEGADTGSEAGSGGGAGGRSRELLEGELCMQ